MMSLKSTISSSLLILAVGAFMFLTSGCSDVADNAQSEYSQTDGDGHDHDGESHHVHDGDGGNHDDKEGHHDGDSDAGVNDD